MVSSALLDPFYINLASPLQKMSCRSITDLKNAAWLRHQARHPKNAATRTFAASDRQGEVANLDAHNKGRREMLLSMTVATSAILDVTFGSPNPADARTAASRQAGDFCPSAATDGFVVYSPDTRSTPAIRAGVIQANPSFYSFDLPPTWKEGTILNILSGNFCMPRCDEPWYEALWESEEEGTATVVVSPLYRLVSKSSATLSDLGPPEQVIERVGPFVTGNYLDSVEDDVRSTAVTKHEDGRTYYEYEVVAPYAKNGTRQLAAFTVKGDLAYLWVLAANDRQWSKSEKTLRHMLKSFVA